MSFKLPCDTVRDLLPLYLDGVASKETSAAVKAHIKECVSCREYLKAAGMSVKNKRVEVPRNEDFTTLKKKINKRALKHDAIAFVASLAVFGGVLATVLTIFSAGNDKTRD